jgi:hypothetical protein
MNNLSNTTVVCSGYGNNNKNNNNNNNNIRGISFLPESLFSMAIYCDMDDSLGQQQDLEPLPAYACTQTSSFYPVDECKDLSLKEILALYDDYFFDHEEDNNMSNSSMLNPIPLNVPCNHNAAASDAASQAYTELSVPMHMENQMQPTMDHTEPTLPNEENVPTIPSTSCQSPIKKRIREEPLDDESDEALNNDGRFRPYQAGLWDERFNELCMYREKHGNCLVPHTFTENRPLTRWVKRQRYQHKRMMECKSSSLTDERVKALEEVGFVWDVQGAAWGERLDELNEFRSNYMHCSVPSNYSANPQLASWVKCQRRQYKLHMEGKASYMTPQRIRDLEVVGFKWLLRSSKKQRTL